MKRFAWRLQRVLDVKEKEEQTKSQALFVLTERIAQKRGELFGQQRVLRTILEDIKKKAPADRIREQEYFLRHSSATDEYIRRLKEEISKLQGEQRQMRQEVLKIRQFKEGLEKLREQAKTEFIAEQEKIEQRELDEMAAIGFSRK